MPDLKNASGYADVVKFNSQSLENRYANDYSKMIYRIWMGDVINFVKPWLLNPQRPFL